MCVYACVCVFGVDSDSRVVLQQGHVLARVTTALHTMCCGAELIGSDTHMGFAITSTDGSTWLGNSNDITLDWDMQNATKLKVHDLPCGCRCRPYRAVLRLEKHHGRAVIGHFL